MYNKTIIEFGFLMISWIIKTSCLCYLPKPKAEADNKDLGFDNSWYHAQRHPIIVYYYLGMKDMLRDIDARSCIIIQQIVTLSKYGHDALDICHP